MSVPKNDFDKPGHGHITSKPKHENPFINDVFFHSILQRLLPANQYSIIYDDLKYLGDMCINKYINDAFECELYKPYLIKYNEYGQRINKLITCQGWKNQKIYCANNGIISIAYVRSKFNRNISRQYWRIYQMSKLFIWVIYSGLYSCPIAMTDGCAKVLSELNFNKLNITQKYKDMINGFYNGLISLNVDEFITSGQWMTERGGGSDVSVNGTNTIAILQDNGMYKLYGYKWFSSASDADISLTLARIEDTNGNIKSGNKGLSCFLVVNTKIENGVYMEQLKDKLGTRQLPTAELELKGTNAILISKIGDGVKTIIKMANITRIHNAISAVGNIRDSLNKAVGYARNRTVFGKKLIDIPLHQMTLGRINILYRVSLLLVMDSVKYLSLTECSKTNKMEYELLLRILTPLVKLYTAKAAMHCVSECIECLGGIGYLETSGLPQNFRDAQVLPVWEGTTNILSLDVLRVLKHPKIGTMVMNAFQNRVKECCKNMGKHGEYITQQMALFQTFMNKYNSNIKILEMFARDISFTLSRIYAGSLLCEQYKHSKDKTDAITLQKFINGSCQGTFFNGGKGLISESIIMAINSFDYNNESQNIKLLASQSKL